MEFKRSLSLFDSVSLMFSSMVGSGIFFTTGFILNQVENPYLVLTCWILGGVFAMAGALTYASPAVLFPQAGGDYIYLREAYSPIVAFMSGWASLTVNFSASISALSIAFSKHFFYFLPGFDKSMYIQQKIFGLNFSLGPEQLLGMLIVFSFTAVNYFGIKEAIRVQNFFTVIKITGLIIFIIAGFLFGTKDFSLFKTSRLFPDLFTNWNSVIAGIVPVTFSYFGWNMVTYLAGEVKDPGRNIPLSVVISCSMVITIYVLINFLFLSSAPLSELKSKEGIGIISAQYLFGNWLTGIISGFICWIILGSLSTMIIGGSRVYYAMARDGLFFPGLAELHPKYLSPYKALIFQALYAIAFITIRELESLLFLITCAILFLAILTAMTPYFFRRRGIISPFSVPGAPVTPILFIAANFIIISILAWEKPAEAAWGMLITLSAIPVYFIFRRTFRKMA
ncbi:MAG: amino acid permease [Leptospira sp.]|nr:amino acid permease [Leptospira sp.]